ncbi:MAG: hypothetical protein ABJA49_09490 [Betaproteobacteria bacterium]
MMKPSNHLGLALAGAPPVAIQRIDHEMNEVLKRAGGRDKLSDAGIEVLGGSSQVLADFMKADNLRYGSLAGQLAIKAD